jgi:L-amino acid N-acyltransferase YncA
VEVSVFLRTAERGRGTGSALYRDLLTTVTDLGYVTAYAGIALPNPASVGLPERLGFVAVGVFCNAGFEQGHWNDVGWWQLNLQPPPAEPAEPLPWPG